MVRQIALADEEEEEEEEEASSDKDIRKTLARRGLAGPARVGTKSPTTYLSMKRGCIQACLLRESLMHKFVYVKMGCE